MFELSTTTSSTRNTGQSAGIGQPASVGQPDGSGQLGSAAQSGGLGQPGGPGQPVAALEAAICELAGHLTAATCRFLVLLGEFDACDGWAGWDMPSCAAWLSWKCQMGSSTAREHVRVARALRSLPVIRAGFAAGRLSYSKVRALTRIADPSSDADLAEMAAPMTANQLDRFARAHRTVSNADAASTRLRRRLIWRYEDDGSLVLTARLPPEDGAAVLTALRAVLQDTPDTTGTGSGNYGHEHGHENRHGHETRHGHGHGDPDGGEAADPAGSTPAEARDPGVRETARPADAPAGARRAGDRAQGMPGGASAGAQPSAATETALPADAPAEARRAGSGSGEARTAWAPAEARPGGASAEAPGTADRVQATSASLADALTEIAEAYLASRGQHAANPDAYQVIVHADPAALAGDENGRCHIEDGPAISTAALQQIICGAVTRWMSHDQHCNPLNVGRRRRDPTPAIRTALRERDRCRCRFPGCHRRATQAHHIRWWFYGGITSLDNLISLCRYHHTLIHQHGYNIAIRGPGAFTFLRPDGKPISPNPPLPEPTGQIWDAHDAEITPDTIVPYWYGERLDLDYAIWVLFANQHAREVREQRQATTAA